VTNCSLVRQVAVLQLPEDQSGYLDSILSRRARLLGLMWDLDKTPLGIGNHELTRRLRVGRQTISSSPPGLGG